MHTSGHCSTSRRRPVWHSREIVLLLILCYRQFKLYTCRPAQIQKILTRGVQTKIGGLVSVALSARSKSQEAGVQLPIGGPLKKNLLDLTLTYLFYTCCRVDILNKLKIKKFKYHNLIGKLWNYTFTHCSHTYYTILRYDVLIINVCFYCYCYCLYIMENNSNYILSIS